MPKPVKEILTRLIQEMEAAMPEASVIGKLKQELRAPGSVQFSSEDAAIIQPYLRFSDVFPERVQVTTNI